MTPDDAKLLLGSSSSHDRLKGARHFARQAEQIDLPFLQSALRTERVSWVKRALLRAVERLEAQRETMPLAAESSRADISELEARQIHARAVEEVTATILHEFQGIVGLIKLDVADEIQDFANSNTKRHLERLDKLIRGIELLRKAAAAPKRRPFDLSSIVHEIGDEESREKGLAVSFDGPEMLVVEGDPDLLRLAICNGIRNAIDAVLSMPEPERKPPVVTWGKSDVDVWVMVIDSGPGLGSSSTGAFKVGASSKPGHSGMGLPIAKQAMESMEGDISLTSARDNGACFEIRWYV